MKKETKEMLKTIIGYQELIMKALKIEVPVKHIEKKVNVIAAPKKILAKKTPSKKVAAKNLVKKR